VQPEITISEEEIYRGQVLDFRVRQVQLPDGSLAGREIAANRGGVAIVALTEDHQVRLVKQFRAAAQTWVIELPAGALKSGENPDEAAPRELLEETGDQAARWQKLAGFFSAPAILTEYLHLYLATGLRPGPNQPEADEFLEVITVPWAEAMAMIRRREIQDAKTIAGLMIAGLHMEDIT
jgi:ADP-ribose pyrophosphatase